MKRYVFLLGFLAFLSVFSVGQAADLKTDGADIVLQADGASCPNGVPVTVIVNGEQVEGIYCPEENTCFGNEGGH